MSLDFCGHQNGWLHRHARAITSKSTLTSPSQLSTTKMVANVLMPTLRPSAYKCRSVNRSRTYKAFVPASEKPPMVPLDIPPADV